MRYRYNRIRNHLVKKFSPEILKIRDDSSLHATHGNIEKDAKETHFYIKMRSSAFCNKSKLNMHKMVYAVLEEEFKKGLHAIELDLGDIK